jgi:asparagine synthase (glutamine-hydrolysing)
MNFSVEIRVPFLNRKLVEFTLSLPEQYLLSPEGETKHILRHSLRGIVPDEILSRRDKIGFEANTSGWGLGSSVLKEVSENLDGLGLLVPEPAKRSIREVINGTRDLDSSLWRVINYARWVKLEGVRGLN